MYSSASPGIAHCSLNFQAVGGAAKGLHTMPGSMTSSQVTGSAAPQKIHPLS